MLAALLLLAPSLRVPVETAYVGPGPEDLTFDRGVHSPWTAPRTTLDWYGRFARGGSVEARLRLRTRQGERATLALVVGSQVSRRETEGGEVDFGSFRVRPGFNRFRLQGLKRTGETFGQVEALELVGPPVEGAHFNLKERRNAASVHLGYPAGEGKVDAFTVEIRPQTEPVWTFYMACGFSRGYLGMQVNSPTERRLIFSVWDAGDEPTDRERVAAEDRVTLVAKGEGVVDDSFGNEGTGGHSHLVYPWRSRERHRFLVTAKPDGAATVYSGYYRFPKGWGLIASFRAPKDGGALRGFHSFVENFWGANGQELRRAQFGHAWVRVDGQWRSLAEARFSADATARAGDRLDFDAGVSGAWWTLQNGGFVEPKHRMGDVLTRSASREAAPDVPAQLLPE